MFLNENVMGKGRARTLEALRVLEGIDHRGSFAAAADELWRVPSALSYPMQKLEEEFDVVLFDRACHLTKFTNVARLLLVPVPLVSQTAPHVHTDYTVFSPRC